MCFHGNQHPWAIKHTFINLFSKYQSLEYIYFPVVNSPVFPSLDDIYCIRTWHDLIFNVTIVHVVDDPLRLRPTNEASDLPPQYYINISTIPLHRIKWHWKWKGKIGQHRRRTVQKKDKATPTKTKVEKKAGKNIVFHSNRDLNIKNPRIFTLEGQIFTGQGHLNFKCPS